MSSFWWNFYHWLHWKLSFWQLVVQPVMKISSKWHFHFSVWHSVRPTNGNHSKAISEICDDKAVIGIIGFSVSLTLGDMVVVLMCNWLAYITDKFISTLVKWLSGWCHKTSLICQVMVWCQQATGHCLSQCWPRSVSPHNNTWPQWINSLRSELIGWHFAQICVAYVFTGS